MNQLKVLPLSQLILSVYPDLYPIHNLNDQVKLFELVNMKRSSFMSI